MADKKKSEELNPILIDKRLVERQLKKGRLSPADFDKYLQGLPDVGDKAENIAGIVYPNQGN
jgi:O-phosphoseryl-tRNA(Cys) synthetase